MGLQSAVRLYFVAPSPPMLPEIRATPTPAHSVACSNDRPANHGQRLCFVLPAANTESAIRDHEQLKANVVKRDDRLINVFPKHQAEMKQVCCLAWREI